MPLTFPSHAAAVLPLKMWRPDRFDGVALVVGSASPDISYALGGYADINTHTVAALFWFCIPVALVGTAIIRRAAPIVAAHLPDLGSWHLRDYGVLRTASHRWWVTVACAWFGALTHIFWDSFTHGRASFWSDSLDHIAFAGRPWWEILQQASTIGGAIATVLMARSIGRGRMLLRNRSLDTQPTRPYAFWPTALAIWMIGFAVLPFLAHWHSLAVMGVRVLIVIALGLLAGVVTVRFAAVRNAGPGTPPRRRDLRQRVPEL